MFKKIITFSILTASFAFSAQVQAAKFANQFLEFELPPQWQCNLEGAEWVCQSTNEQKKRDAIIVLAAKLKGDQDSLDQYLTYLKGAKIYNSVQGKSVKSEPKYAKTIALNNHAWVDALHLESEIPGFYTRYLATVKEDIGVLVSYSINKAKYQQYLNEFENMVKTLRVFRKSGGINAAPPGSNIFDSNKNIPNNVTDTTVFPNASPEGGAENAPKRQDGSMLPFLLILAPIAYLVWRRRQNKR